jgi:hypothetical protein
MRSPVNAAASWRALWLFIVSMLLLAFYLARFVRLSLIDAPSFFILAVTSYVVWRIYDVRRDRLVPILKSRTRIWLLVSIGFAYLALDEALSIHEAIDLAGHWLLGATETGFSDRADDIIVLFYGIAGCVVLFMHREELGEFWRNRGLFALAFTLFGMMVAIDIVGNRPDIFEFLGYDVRDAHILQHRFDFAEDVFKLLGECVFLVAFARIFESVERASHDLADGHKAASTQP